MPADIDAIPFAETLSVRDDGIVRVLVLRRELETRHTKGPRAWCLELWHQRIDRPRAIMRRLMIYSDTGQGREAAEAFADFLVGAR